MEYGTKSIRSESISLYQGFSASNVTDNTYIYNGHMGVVNQRDVDLVFFQKKVLTLLINVKRIVCGILW